MAHLITLILDSYCRITVGIQGPASCQMRHLSVLVELFLICLRTPPASPKRHWEIHYLKNGIRIRFLKKTDNVRVCHS